MYSCPLCAKGVEKPIRTWITYGKPRDDWVIPRYTVGGFKCSRCTKEFEHLLAMELLKLVNVNELKEMEARIKKLTEESSALGTKVTELGKEKTDLEAAVKDLGSQLGETELSYLGLWASRLESDVERLRTVRVSLQERLDRSAAS